MEPVDFGGMVAAFGPVGALLAAVIIALHKTGFLKREDPSRNDVLKEVRSTNDKIDKMDREMTDRLARIETRQAEQDRRITRIE